MNKNTKRLFIGSGIAAGMGAVGAAHHALTKYLVNVALDRQIPKHIPGSERRLSGSRIDPELLHRLDDAAEKLRGSGCQTVHITSRDGTPLAGHWHECENAERVILAMHGWRSSWAHDFGLIADLWFQNGCSVLFAEQRGQGESGGKYMGFGLLERYDCLDWVNWLNENGCKNRPVYLAGVSMGASTVLMAGGLDLPENVRGIMADCGYTSAEAVFRHIAKNNLRLSYASRSRAASSLCRKKIQTGIGDYSCVDAMRVCKVPVLFAHGTDDRFVPVEMTYENYKACAAPKRLLVVPGAEHGMSYLKDKEVYESTVKRFWQDCDPAP